MDVEINKSRLLTQIAPPSHQGCDSYRRLASWRVIFLPAVGMLSGTQGVPYIYFSGGNAEFPNQRTNFNFLTIFFPI